jgi:hypothetical protein
VYAIKVLIGPLWAAQDLPHEPHEYVHPAMWLPVASSEISGEEISAQVEVAKWGYEKLRAPNGLYECAALGPGLWLTLIR